MLAFAEERNQALAREQCRNASAQDFSNLWRNWGISMVGDSTFGRCRATGFKYLPSTFESGSPFASQYLPQCSTSPPVENWPGQFANREAIPFCYRRLKAHYCWSCWSKQVERQIEVRPCLEHLLDPEAVEAILGYGI